MGIEKHEELKKIMREKPEYRDLLYTKSFIITDDDGIDLTSYPLYGKYSRFVYNGLSFLTDKRMSLYKLESGGVLFYLIGSCCDPFEKETDENVILSSLSAAYNKDAYFEKLNCLTGIFVTGYYTAGKELCICGDACCIQTAYYGTVNGKLYVSSHAQLLGDVCALKRDPYIEELISYKHYRKFGRMLPGDLSPYKEFRHTIPNNAVYYKDGSFRIKRFWPVSGSEPLKDCSYDGIISECASILKSTMSLFAGKYHNAAISMSGGCDSKTTLSCAKDCYGKFSYYSYESSKPEEVDAVAAHDLAASLGLDHVIHHIPGDDSAYDDIEIIRMIINCNCGYIGVNNENDVRKRAYYLKNKTFDTEIKSWVSEVARAYYYKRFARKKFPKKVTPRYMTAMYKVFYTERSLVRKTDKVFEEYLSKYYDDKTFGLVPWTDLLFWEYRISSWNSLVISHEQQLSYDIAIPYNNRKLLELLLKTPLEKRIADVPHKDIQIKANPAIASSDIAVTNLLHTSKRAKLERAYLAVQTKLPF